MKLKKLYLENIRSYRRGEIEFPPGSTLLSGDIGSGKTTLLLAISFALFGLQPGQRGSSLLASSSDTGMVRLTLEVNENEIEIERKLKRSSRSISQEYSAISVNGDKEELSVTELKAKVLNYLNYPLEFVKKTNILYNYTVYSPQEQMKQIILEDAETRLNVLRHIFGVEKYKKIRENLSIFASKLREESRILQHEIRDLDESKTLLESQKEYISLLEEKINSKSEELQIKLEERNLIEEKIKEIQGKIEEKNKFEKEIEKTNVALTYKLQEKSRLENEIRDLNKKILEFPEFDEETHNKIIKDISKKKSVIEGLNRELITLSSRIDSLNQLKESDLLKKQRIFKIDMCPTCLQDVPEPHKHNILNETENQLVKTEKELKGLNQNISIISSTLESEKNTVAELESKKSELDILKSKLQDIQKFKENLNTYTKQEEELDKDSNLLKKHIESLKNSVLEFKKYDNIYIIRQDELKSAFQGEKNVEIELAELKKELELTKKEITIQLKKIQQKELSKTRLSNVLEIEQWLSTKFSDLVSFTEKNIMMKLRNEFSRLFNKWFSMLTTDAFFVNLDETFSPIILQGDYELDYSFLSGGERTAVALPYRLALNQIINSLFSRLNTKDLVILDEPTDGFSSQQLDKIRDILNELSIGQLIIVSHEPQIENFVDNVIKVKKEEGSSRIIQRNI